MTPNIINEKIIINIRISKYFVKFLTIYYLGDIIQLNENKQYNKNTNMKQTIKLSESELKRVIAESVKRVINEVWDIDDNGVIDYDDDFGYDFIEGNEDTPRSVRKNQMNADFENNRTPKPYNSKYYYDDFNMNTYDFNGDLGMKALKGDKFAKTLRRNTPQGWVDAAKDSKID